MNTFCAAALFLSVLAASGCSTRPTSVSLPATSEEHMQSDLSQACVHLDEFEEKENIDDLREAADLLQGISTSVEANLGPGAKQRDSVLVAWLRLLSLIDSGLDPSFDPKDVPAI